MEGWFEVCENRVIPENSKSFSGKNTVNTVVGFGVKIKKEPAPGQTKVNVNA
jgi:hypothetical protein